MQVVPRVSYALIYYFLLGQCFGVLSITLHRVLIVRRFASVNRVSRSTGNEVKIMGKNRKLRLNSHANDATVVVNSTKFSFLS